MKDEIILYRQMCDNEKVQTLQRGMNFRLNPNYSVILMSQRKNAPYNDYIHDDGITIEYEGHDLIKSKEISDTKNFDQPERSPSGRLTQNGLFIKSVHNFKKNNAKPELVKVYEKILPGIWCEKGFFDLIDYKIFNDGKRNVFRFILRENYIDLVDSDIHERKLKPRNRLIPTNVKRIVWERDQGKCVICGKNDELHFDHDLPYSKGGSSINPDNVKILCARHNLMKSDKII